MKYYIPIIVMAILASCSDTDVEVFERAQRVETLNTAPPGATDGTCWSQDKTPAIIETVTEHIIMTPEVRDESGTIITPATYRTETRQDIVQPRQDKWFETPCPEELTPEFIASLQRALQARGIYKGAINGEMDSTTRRAVRVYQKPLGLNSSRLSKDAATKLGLLAIFKRPTTENQRAPEDAL